MIGTITLFAVSLIIFELFSYIGPIIYFFWLNGKRDRFEDELAFHGNRLDVFSMLVFWAQASIFAVGIVYSKYPTIYFIWIALWYAQGIAIFVWISNSKKYDQEKKLRNVISRLNEIESEFQNMEGNQKKKIEFLSSAIVGIRNRITNDFL